MSSSDFNFFKQPPFLPYVRPDSIFLKKAIVSGSHELIKANGRVVNINGHRFYSPNCKRDVCLPPKPSNSSYFNVNRRFYDDKTPSLDGLRRCSKTDDVAELHQPLWWTGDYGHLAFLPIDPVPPGIIDYIFDTPSWYTASSAGFSLDPSFILAWNRLEFDIRNAVKLLSDRVGIPFMAEIIDTAVACTGFYDKVHLLRADVNRSKDWFSYWLCRLSYTIAASMTASDDAAFGIESDADTGSIKLPQWYRHLDGESYQQRYLTSMHVAAGTFDGSVPRAGVFVDILHPESDQYSVDWFIKFDVPVWYPWGPEEILAAASRPEIARLAPLDCIPQSPSYCFAREINNATHYSIMNEGTTYASWRTFFEDREHRNAKIRSLMPESQLRSLDCRQRCPPFRRGVSVYIWIRIHDVYQRIPLCRASFDDAFAEHGNKRSIYDALENAWDLCKEIGDGLCESDSDSDIEIFGSSSSPRLPASPLQVSPRSTASSIDLPVPSAELVDDARTALVESTTSLLTKPYQLAGSLSLNSIHLASAVTERRMDPNLFRDVQDGIKILNEHYGFVLPIPLIPTEGMNDLTELQQKKYAIFVGRSVPDADLFGAAAIHVARFFDHLSSKFSTPSADLWDLARGNRLCLLSSPRLRALRAVSGSLYVFDFGSLSQVEWKIAVTRASTALLICRMNANLSEYEVAFRLLQKGIPFYTLSARSFSVPNAPPLRPLPVCVHGKPFLTEDYNSYLLEREALLSNPRIARAALLQGGIVWRLVGQSSQFATALLGPSPAVAYHQIGTVVCTSKSGVSLWDDVISCREKDVLCGTMICMTGIRNEYMLKSWWPRDTTWKECVPAHWSTGLEEWFTKRELEIKKGEAMPLSTQQWRRKLRGSSFERRVYKRTEIASEAFIEANKSSSSF